MAVGIPDAGVIAPVEPPEERALADLAPLVEPCLRVMSRDVEQARRDYFGWADRETGPEPRRGGWIRELYPSQLERCREAVHAVSSTPPPVNEVDAAGAGLVSAAAALFTLAADAHQYYRRQDHRDDDLAHGRELHPRLVSAFDAYEGAHQQLAALLEAAQRRARESRLSRFEAEPARRGRYLVELVVSQSIELLELVDTIELAEEGRYTTPRRDGLVARTEVLRRSVDELRTERETSLARSRRARDVVQAADRLANEAVILMRRVRDGEVLSREMLRAQRRTSCGFDHGTPLCVREAHEALLREYERW